MHAHRAVGNYPAVLAGLRASLGSLWADSGLAERQREQVVLVVARVIDALGVELEAGESFVGWTPATGDR